jgi:hypothetical protein
MLVLTCDLASNSSAMRNAASSLAIYPREQHLKLHRFTRRDDVAGPNWSGPVVPPEPLAQIVGVNNALTDEVQP